jgi:hypothetical protein
MVDGLAESPRHVTDPEGQNMGIEQLRELLERLQTDPSQVTSEELSQAREFIREQRGHLASQDVSDEVIAALEELRDSFTAVRAVQDERATAAAELDEKRRGRLSEIEEPEPASGTTTEPPPGEGEGGDPTAGDPSATEPTTTEQPSGDFAAAEPAEGAPETQPLAASAKPARRAPIGTFRTSQPAPPQDERLVARTVVTAAGGSPGFMQGQAINSTAELAKAFAEKIKAMATGRAAGSDKVYVANARTEFPESRLLRAADWVGNFTKMEQATSPQALTAAGGICQPLQPLYDVEVIGSSARPVRDALAPFGVDRGGIQYRPPTSAATVLADAVGTWTSEQDADDSGDTKGCYEVVCPGVEEAMVQAIWLCLEFSNISARFDPESTAANVRQGLITHARKAENELLRLIQNESKVLSAAKVIGATRDLLANIDKASAYYRNRHRIDTEITMTCILPAWVRYMMRTDIARQMAAGDWMQALGVTDMMIDRWFRDRGVVPAWHLDGGIGGTNEVQTLTITGSPTGGTYTLTFDGETTAAIPYNATAADVKDALDDLPGIGYNDVTVAGGPHPGTAITVAFGGQYEATNVPQMTATGSFTGGSSPAITPTTTTASGTTSTVNGVSIASQVYGNAAAGAAIPGYPDQVDALLFPTGSILFLDGGTLDLGLVRDSTLNSRNRYRQFSETFEGIANRAVEPLRLAMTVQPTGQTAGTADTSAIAD